MNDLTRYAEFSTNYLPDFFNYVVPILNANGELGSGVLVNCRGRHIVATAKHCIENKPRVFRPTSRIGQNETVSMRQLRILGARLHDMLDIGFLEIEDPDRGEMTADQLREYHITDGMVHIIGYPMVMAQVDWPNSNVEVWCGSFGTTLLKATEEFLKFDYPKVGSKLNPANNEWIPSTFPETPHGFSGGGCFGMTAGAAGHLQVIEYKLVGIQSSWSEVGRWVKVIPIKHLCDLLAQ